MISGASRLVGARQDVTGEMGSKPLRAPAQRFWSGDPACIVDEPRQAVGQVDQPRGVAGMVARDAHQREHTRFGHRYRVGRAEAVMDALQVPDPTATPAAGPAMMTGSRDALRRRTRHMIELDESVVVDRPREAVFAHIARIEAVPDWLPVVQEATLLDPGDVRVGSLVRLAIAGPGARVTATGEITELVAPERIAMRTLDAPVNLAARGELEALDERRTRLHLTGQIALPGLLRFAEGTVRDRIRREAPAALEELRRRIEAAVPAGGS